MDENINDKISSLLSSPDFMTNVQNVLSGFTGEKALNTATDKNGSIMDFASAMQTLSSNNILSGLGKFLKENQNERIALLSALRPFLSAEKQETLDLVIQLLKIASVLFATNIAT